MNMENPTKTLTVNENDIVDKRIDFVAFASAQFVNPNGDPNTNLPRTIYVDGDEYGEMSDVCIKRKLRNRLQDMGEEIFIQSDDRVTDGFTTLKNRWNDSIPSGLTEGEVKKLACEKWIDVRAFGNVAAYKTNGKKGKKKEDNAEEKEGKGVSIGISGPVTVCPAHTISPVDVETVTITKSVSGDSDSDTIGKKSRIPFGLYKITGSINPFLANKTGFTWKDANMIKECFSTLFMNDVSAARPEGSMFISNVYWFTHDAIYDKCSAYKVYNSVVATLKDPNKTPTSISDYDIEVVPIPGANLSLEIVEGC